MCSSSALHYLLLALQTACEKTVSVMHHVIRRTITYANGKAWFFLFFRLSVCFQVVVILIRLRIVLKSKNLEI